MPGGGIPMPGLKPGGGIIPATLVKKMMLLTLLMYAFQVILKINGTEQCDSYKRYPKVPVVHVVDNREEGIPLVVHPCEAEVPDPGDLDLAGQAGVAVRETVAA